MTLWIPKIRNGNQRKNQGSPLCCSFKVQKIVNETEVTVIDVLNFNSMIKNCKRKAFRLETRCQGRILRVFNHLSVLVFVNSFSIS